jgi:serine/threonine-protein kinase
MATVHYGRQQGAAGFARMVAIKRVHEHLAQDPAFVTMFLDEARLAARIRHPNVVQIFDVVAEGDELSLVMEYIHGETLAGLSKRLRGKGTIPVPVAAAILVGALDGLHAAHEAKGSSGEPLNVVHRDLSPQNVLVGADGVARVLDFGVAWANARVHQTEDGKVRGKLRYIAPEMLRGDPIDRRADVYAAGVLLWEALAGRPLFGGKPEAEIVDDILFNPIPRVDSVAPDVPAALAAVVARALARPRDERYRTASEFARAVEGATPVALVSQVATWVEELLGPELAKRAAALERIEAAADLSDSEESPPAERGPAPTFGSASGAKGMRPGSGAPLPSPSRLEPGVRVDRYELLNIVARGGMGEVWVARLQGKHGFEKLVAIKTILPLYASEERFRRMFLDEAKVAAAIEHGNVAQILDLGEYGDRLYLVMEWIEGDSLGALSRVLHKERVRWPAGVLLRIFADACSGLHAAHELVDACGAPLAVVHRDVSPQNVLVSTRGTVKVIDFGVAKARDRMGEQSTSGLKGKVRFMAPEQAKGNTVDRRADVWAIGATMRYLLTGDPPYPGDDVGILRAILAGAPPLPLPGNLPPPLREVLGRALSVDRERRFASALEFSRALEATMVKLDCLVTAADVAAFVAPRMEATLRARREAIDAVLGELDASGRSHGPEPASPANAHAHPSPAPVRPTGGKAASPPVIARPATRGRGAMRVAVAVAVTASVVAWRSSTRPTAPTGDDEVRAEGSGAGALPTPRGASSVSESIVLTSATADAATPAASASPEAEAAHPPGATPRSPPTGTVAALPAAAPRSTTTTPGPRPTGSHSADTAHPPPAPPPSAAPGTYDGIIDSRR